MRHFISLLVVLTPLSSACSDNRADDPECDGRIAVAVTSSVPETVSSDLVVRGTAVPTRNVAIRSVAVAGIPAEPGAFNFGVWSVTVPFTALLAIPADSSAPDEVMVSVVASPSCGSSGEAEFSAHLDRHPEIRVSTLTISPVIPASRTFLPADGSASAILTLSANPEARGATATVVLTGPGQFEGDGTSATPVLAGDGAGPASADLLATANGRGTLFVTARAGSAVAAPVAIAAAGAPRIVPAEATLGPGQQLAVSVLTDTDAQQVTCDVSASSGITVTVEDENRSYGVSADAGLAAAAEATIRCRDGFGQSASGTYDAKP